RLHLASNLQRDSSPLCHIDGDMSALDGSNATNKAKVLLFFLDQFVLVQLNAVVDSPKPRHHLVFALRIADRNVIRLRIVRVKGDLGTRFLKTLGQVPHEQLRPSILLWWYRDEGRRDQGDSHSKPFHDIAPLI